MIPFPSTCGSQDLVKHSCLVPLQALAPGGRWAGRPLFLCLQPFCSQVPWEPRMEVEVRGLILLGEVLLAVGSRVWDKGG